MRFVHLNKVNTIMVSLQIAFCTSIYADEAATKDETFIQAGYGFLQESHSLDATDGFNSQLSPANGARYSLFSMIPREGYAIQTKIERLSATFKDIPSITPNQITSSTLHIKSGVLFPIGGNLKAGTSLFYLKRKSTETTPKQLVAEYHQVGIGIDAMHESREIFGKTNLETSGSVEIPLAIKEQSARTGSYYFGYNFEAGVNLAHRVATWQVLSTGIAMRYSAMNFSGYGEQGTYEGKMRQTDFWIPLELRIVF